MEIFIIILITVVVLVFVAIRFGKKEKPKTLLDEFLNNPIVKEQKEMYDIQCKMIDALESATDLDEIPSGEGEFGYKVTNPIPTKGVLGSITYLAGLTTLDGEKVRYERLGSTRAINIEKPIDIYQISDSNGEICRLYLSIYHKKNSNKAPRDFIQKASISKL